MLEASRSGASRDSGRDRPALTLVMGAFSEASPRLSNRFEGTYTDRLFMTDRVLELEPGRSIQGTALPSLPVPRGFESYRFVVPPSASAGDSASENSEPGNSTSDGRGGGPAGDVPPAESASVRRSARAGTVTRTVVLDSARRDRLLSAGAQDPVALAAGPFVSGWLEGGRTRHAIIEFEGEAWVLKAYRRGGFFREWNSTRYWGYRRFLHELEVASVAMEKGVPTPEFLALVFEGAGLGWVRSWSVTRYLPGAKPLSDCFGHPDEATIFRAAGAAVARMHDAGIAHPDLHLANILASYDDGEALAYIVDWDRALCRSRKRLNLHASLSRLWRSVEKLRQRAMAEGSGAGGYERFSRGLVSFVRGYFGRDVAAFRRAREYFRRRALWMGLRTFWSARR